jgi:hypothetical protein
MSSGSTALLSGVGLQVNTSKFQGVVDMPLSRTRSLLNNINGSANGSLDSSGGSDSFLPHVIPESSSHHGSHHHLPPLKGGGGGGPQSLVSHSKPSYVGVEVGVGVMRLIATNNSSSVEDSSISSSTNNSSMLPPPGGISNGSLMTNGSGSGGSMSNGVNGGGGGGNGNNYSHMSVSTTQIGSVSSLPPTSASTIARPHSADFTVGYPPPLSGESNKMTPNRTKYKSIPVTPEQVIKLYHSRLTPFEISEINTYPEVYFIGLGAKKRPGIVGSSNNNGYDDDQGSYIHVQHDHVGYRYEVLKVIGKGSFGQVVKAFDHKSNVHVALKMVRNEKRFHRQAQEEIRILEHLRDLDKDNNMNIIHMCDHFTFRNHTCITFELLSLNLYELIKKNKFQGFSLQLVRKFAHSLLQCLDALARNKIIHCDMKPENVLLKQQGRSGIKVTHIFNIFSLT